MSCTVNTGAVAITGYKASDLLPADGSGYIDLRCSCSGLDCIAFTFSIEIQGTANGGPGARRMKRNGGAETLDYGLYRDAARLLPWGTDLNGYGALWLLNQFGTTQRIPVYGRAPAGQVKPAGEYTDAPPVVVTF